MGRLHVPITSSPGVPNVSLNMDPSAFRQNVHLHPKFLMKKWLSIITKYIDFAMDILDF